MIFSLVSITNGSSVFVKACFVCIVIGIGDLENPTVPRASDVITAPMSLKERNTPPSSLEIPKYNITCLSRHVFSTYFTLN